MLFLALFFFFGGRGGKFVCKNHFAHPSNMEASFILIVLQTSLVFFSVKKENREVRVWPPISTNIISFNVNIKPNTNKKASCLLSWFYLSLSRTLSLLYAAAQKVLEDFVMLVK